MKKKLHSAQGMRTGPGPGSAALQGHGGANGSVGGPPGAAGPRPGVAGAIRPAAAPPSFNLGTLVVLAGIFVWSYWPTIAGLWDSWNRDEDYSGGKVVGLIAAYLVWSDRKALAELPVRTCWWGLAVVLIAQVIRLAAVLFNYGSFEQHSLALSAIGIVLLVFGAPVAWRLKWVLAFLFLMFPLPRRLHMGIALPLQNWATTSAVFGLELLGIIPTREGTILKLSEKTTIAVAEACSGLRMLTAFVVVAATLAFVVRRPAWQKVVLLLSSIPVAIGCNTLRLIITAVLYEYSSSEVADKFFHDFAGLTMMPVAVGASVGLLYLMKWVASPAPSAPPGAG